MSGMWQVLAAVALLPGAPGAELGRHIQISQLHRIPKALYAQLDIKAAALSRIYWLSH